MAARKQRAAVVRLPGAKEAKTRKEWRDRAIAERLDHESNVVAWEQLAATFGDPSAVSHEVRLARKVELTVSWLRREVERGFVFGNGVPFVQKQVEDLDKLLHPRDADRRLRPIDFRAQRGWLMMLLDACVESKVTRVVELDAIDPSLPRRVQLLLSRAMIMGAARPEVVAHFNRTLRVWGLGPGGKPSSANGVKQWEAFGELLKVSGIPVPSDVTLWREYKMISSR